MMRWGNVANYDYAMFEAFGRKSCLTVRQYTKLPLHVLDALPTGLSHDLQPL